MASTQTHYLFCLGRCQPVLGIMSTREWPICLEEGSEAV